MKKLTYLVSAIAAGLVSSAHADISVSGSGSVAYQSSGSDNNLHNGGSVNFAMSTTAASGMTVSMAGNIENTTTSGGPAGAVDGFDNLTFATGGVTITVGHDIGLPDGVGEVGGLVSDLTALNSNAITSTTGIYDDEGAGVSLSTSFGSAAVSLYYVADSTPTASGDIDGAADTGSGIKLSTSFGDVAVTAGYAAYSDASRDDTESGVSASYVTSAGTITAGYTASTGTSDGNSVGVKYAMDLDADTAIAFGYQDHQVGSNSGRATDVTLSRSLGGGVSVYAEMRSTSGDTGTSGNASTMSIGTSVAF